MVESRTLMFFQVLSSQNSGLNMDLPFTENFGNLTMSSLIQLKEGGRRLYEKEAGGSEGAASDLLNWTAAAGPRNQSNLTLAQGLPPPPPDKNWLALLTALVIVVTIAGNILVIMAVLLEKKLQNATNYFLMSLAVADMLLGFLVMPPSMLNILYHYEWPLNRMLCAVWIYLDVLFSTASIMHLCAISLDRYIAIRNPIHHSRFNSRTKAFAKIIAVWTISVGDFLAPAQWGCPQCPFGKVQAWDPCVQDAQSYSVLSWSKKK